MNKFALYMKEKKANEELQAEVKALKETVAEQAAQIKELEAS